MGKRGKKRAHSAISEEAPTLVADTSESIPSEALELVDADSVAGTAVAEADTMDTDGTTLAEGEATELEPTKEGGGLFALGDPLQTRADEAPMDRNSKLGIPRWLAEPVVVSADTTAPVGAAEVAVRDGTRSSCGGTISPARARRSGREPAGAVHPTARGNARPAA